MIEIGRNLMATLVGLMLLALLALCAQQGILLPVLTGLSSLFIGVFVLWIFFVS